MTRTFSVRFWLLISAGFAVAGGCSSGDDGPTGPSNHVPVIQPQADTTVAVGDTLRLRAVAHDRDGDSLTLSAATIGSLSDFMARGFPDTEFDQAGGQFEFRARAIDRPNRVFRFTVDDHQGGADSTFFTVYVN